MTLRDDAERLKNWSGHDVVYAHPDEFARFMDTVRRVASALLVMLPPPKQPGHDAEMADWDEFFRDPKFRGMLGTTEPIENPDYQGD